MKRSIRYIALCLAVLLTATSFCGCDDLDKAKKNHGFYQEDGTILWNGAVYREIIPTYNTFNPSYDYEQTIAITQPNVPVLLKEFFGDHYCKTADEVLLIQTYTSGAIQYDHMVYYCREDKFEELTEKMEQGFTPDTYFYEYYELDEDGFYLDEVTYVHLKDKEIKAIDDILMNVEPQALPNTASLTADYFVDIWGASEDMYFRQYLLELNKSGDEFFLSIYPDDEEGDIYYYEVPEQYNTVFEQLMAPYIQAENIYWEDYEEYNYDDEVVVEFA